MTLSKKHWVVFAVVLLSLAFTWPWDKPQPSKPAGEKKGEASKQTLEKTTDTKATAAPKVAAAKGAEVSKSKMAAPKMKETPKAKELPKGKETPKASSAGAQKKALVQPKEAKPATGTRKDSTGTGEDSTSGEAVNVEATPTVSVVQKIQEIPKVQKIISKQTVASVTALPQGVPLAQKTGNMTVATSGQNSVARIQTQIQEMLRVNEGLKRQYRSQAADIQKVMEQAKIHQQILKGLDELKDKKVKQPAPQVFDAKEVLRQEKIRLIEEQTQMNQAFLKGLMTTGTPLSAMAQSSADKNKKKQEKSINKKEESA